MFGARFVKKGALVYLLLVSLAVLALLAFGASYVSASCCVNPNAIERVCASTDVSLSECCPSPPSDYPRFYGGSVTAVNCMTDYFVANTNCNGVPNCIIGCCCPSGLQTLKSSCTAPSTFYSKESGKTCTQLCQEKAAPPPLGTTPPSSGTTPHSPPLPPGQNARFTITAMGVNKPKMQLYAACQFVREWEVSNNWDLYQAVAADYAESDEVDVVFDDADAPVYDRLIVQSFVNQEGNVAWNRVCKIKGVLYWGYDESECESPWRRVDLAAEEFKDSNGVDLAQSDKTFSGFDTFIFDSRDGSRKILQSFVHKDGWRAWNRVCNYDEADDHGFSHKSDGCTAWNFVNLRDEDFADSVGGRLAGSEKTFYGFDDYIFDSSDGTRKIVQSFVHHDGWRAWNRVCTIDGSFHAYDQKSCEQVWRFVDLSLEEMTDAAGNVIPKDDHRFAGFDVYSFNGDDGKKHLVQTFVHKDGKRSWRRICDVDPDDDHGFSHKPGGCSGWYLYELDKYDMRDGSGNPLSSNSRAFHGFDSFIFDFKTKEKKELSVQKISINNDNILNDGARVYYDKGSGQAAFDGKDLVYRQAHADLNYKMPWNGALRFSSVVLDCRNGRVDYGEVDIDCGGSCGKCADGKYCSDDSVCQSNFCSSENRCTRYCSSAGVCESDMTPNVEILGLISETIEPNGLLAVRVRANQYTNRVQMFMNDWDWPVGSANVAEGESIVYSFPTTFSPGLYKVSVRPLFCPALASCTEGAPIFWPRDITVIPASISVHTEVKPGLGLAGTLFSISSFVSGSDVNEIYAEVLDLSGEVIETLPMQLNFEDDGKAVYVGAWDSSGRAPGQFSIRTIIFHDSGNSSYINPVKIFPQAVCEDVMPGNDPLADRHNIVFVGMGFPSRELFMKYARMAADASGMNYGILSVEPFKSNRAKFNFYAVYQQEFGGNYVQDGLALANSCPFSNKKILFMIYDDETGGRDGFAYMGGEAFCGYNGGGGVGIPAATDFYGEKINVLNLFGQSSIADVTRNQVTGLAQYHSSGVIVDKSSRPNRVYVVDTGNNRILGYDGLGYCRGSTSITCTADSDCSNGCLIDGSKPADMVFGQDDLNSGSCNRDGNIGVYIRPRESTLCLMGLPYSTNTAEYWMRSNFDVDSSGNVYIVDTWNNRVLRYNSPFSDDKRGGKGDNLADFVIGQDDFSGHGINRGSSALSDNGGKVDNVGLWTSRSAIDGGAARGVSVDSEGNVWVADIFNSRVLRFPRDSKEADLVIGQPDFSRSGCSTGKSDRFCLATAAKVRPDTGQLYVLDEYPAPFKGRILVFDPPFSNGMSAKKIIVPRQDDKISGWNGSDEQGTYFFQATGFEFNPYRQGDYAEGVLWVNEHETFRTVLIDDNGDVVKVIGAKGKSERGGDSQYTGGCPSIYQDFRLWWPGGSIGFDSDNNIYFADERFNRVTTYRLPYDLITLNGKACLPDPRGGTSPGGGFNLKVAKELGESVGIAVFANQLIVKDEQSLKVWNGYLGKPVGASPDLYLEGSFADRVRISQAIDDKNRLWIYNEQFGIKIYQLPFKGNDAPLADVVKLFWNDDGSEVSYGPGTIAYDKVSKAIYVADIGNHRVLRIKNYDEFREKLYVDMVIGQPDKQTVACNQDQTMPWRASGDPSADSLCQPIVVKFDSKGNMFVVENDYECHGNDRIVVFYADDLKNANGMFPSIEAKKAFIGALTRKGPCEAVNYPASPVSIAFNSKDEMVVGSDGYYPSSQLDLRHKRQIFVYKNPLVKGSPDYAVQLPMGAPGEIVFDQDDNLIVQDHTWGRIWVVNLDKDTYWKVPIPGDSA